MKEYVKVFFVCAMLIPALVAAGLFLMAPTALVAAGILPTWAGWALLPPWWGVIGVFAFFLEEKFF